MIIDEVVYPYIGPVILLLNRKAVTIIALAIQRPGFDRRANRQ